MKLATDIKPRRDGTVTAVTESGKKYEFKPDMDGRLVADVQDQGDVEFLLDAGFFPADEVDIGAGIKLMDGGEGNGNGAGGDEGEGGTGDAGAGGTAPIEANTPPKPKADAKPKDAKKK